MYIAGAKKLRCATCDTVHLFFRELMFGKIFHCFHNDPGLRSFDTLSILSKPDRAIENKDKNDFFVNQVIKSSIYSSLDFFMAQPEI